MSTRKKHLNDARFVSAGPAQPAPARTSMTAAMSHPDEELYRLLFENNPAMCFSLDRDGTVLSVNQFGAEQLGYTVDELTGQSVLTVFHDEDKPAVHCQLALLLEQPGQARRWQLRKVKKDGTVMWVEEYARAIERADGATMVLVVCSNISDRKHIEGALQENQRQYKLLVDQATDIIYRADATGHFTFVNPTATRLTGYAESELLGHRFIEFIRPDYRARVARFYWHQFARKTPTTYFEFPVVTKSGRVLWFGQNVQTLCENGLVAGFQAVTRDITGRKRAEEALAESEKRLKAILEAEPECVKVVTDSGILLDMNAAGLAMIEADCLEAVRGRSVLPIIVPAHRDAFAEFTRRVHDGTPEVMQFEIVGLKGRHLWLETHAVPLRDERNLPIGVLAVTRDITERKLAEERLKTTTRQLETLIQTSPLAIMSLSTDGNTVVRWNQAAEQIFGWREEEVLGRPLPNIPPGLEDESDALWDRAVREECLQGVELRRAKKDGTMIDIALWATVVKNAEGRVTDTFGIVEDITDRKRVEKALRSSEEALRRALQEREQLARNLHDNIIQSIYAIGLTVEESQSLARTSPTGATRKLDQVVASLNRVIREVRGYLAAPVEKESETLSGDELIASLDRLSKLMEHADGVRFAMAIAPDAVRALTDSQRAQFLYVAQEAMSNSLRHSSSSTARVSLACTSRGIRLEIRDNGVGFSLSRMRNGSGGLKNIRLRARKIGANLDIASHPMGGTIVSMEIQTGP